MGEKLTKAQAELLRLVDNGNKSVVEGYRPAQKLVALGLADFHWGRLGGCWLELTEAGRLALKPGAQQ